MMNAGQVQAMSAILYIQPDTLPSAFSASPQPAVSVTLHPTGTETSSDKIRQNQAVLCQCCHLSTGMKLVLSSFPQGLILCAALPFSLSLFLLPSLATHMSLHVKLLTLFFPFIVQKPLKTLPLTCPPTLSICVQFGCQKPTSRRS